MRFKVDENVPADAAEALRLAGYEACTVRDQSLTGQPDRIIASVCQNEKRIIVTMDKDFSDIRQYPPEEYEGIIILRTDDQSKPAAMRLMQSVIAILDKASPVKNLWIVSEDRIRFRHGGII